MILSGCLLACAVCNAVGIGCAFYGFLLREWKCDSSHAHSWIYGGLTLTLLSVLGWVAIVSHKTGYENRAPGAPSGPSQPPVWMRYTTPDGRCSAEFPEEPRNFEGRLETIPIGKIYCLQCSDVSAELGGLNDEWLFEWVREIIISNGEDDPAKQNEITAERKVVVDGCIGREWEFSWGKDRLGRGRVKAIIREGKLYRVIAIKPFPEQQDQDMKRFTDSFRFENPKP